MNVTKALLISTSLAGLIAVFSSCKTYYIPVDSFRQQFAGMNDSNMREVTTQGPIGHRVKYMTYPIDSIHAVDKKGNPVTILNGPSIETRFTDKRNKKTIFYFDLLRFDGTNVTGSRSRIITTLTRTIPINDVKRIEVQNGNKNYHYIVKPN